MEKNQEVKLKIESVSSEGSGVAHYDGEAVFVSGVCPGDEIICHIIKAKKTYSIGKAVKIISPSADRTENDCPAFPSCGGCVYRAVKYDAEKKIKYRRVEDDLKRIGKIDIKPEEVSSASENSRYRNKAEYPVRLFGGKVVCGFFAKKSHRVIDVSDCLLQPAEFSKICSAVKRFIEKNHITVYDEESGKGLVRHVYLRKAEVTGEIMVCLVINGEKIPKNEDFVKCILNSADNIKSVVLNVNRDKTNVILGKKNINLFGGGYIFDVLAGVKIRLSPLSFYQVNHAAAEILYSSVMEFLSPEGTENIVDLYCGAGTIGLSLAKYVKSVSGVEINPDAVKDAKENAKLNKVENAEFFLGDASEAAEKFLKEGRKIDAVIVDPPRKGLDRSLIETICKMNPERVVYVSCDPATFSRDLSYFAEKNFMAEKIRPVDMFPRTAGIENVALIARNIRKIEEIEKNEK